MPAYTIYKLSPYQEMIGADIYSSMIIIDTDEKAHKLFIETIKSHLESIMDSESWESFLSEGAYDLFEENTPKARRDYLKTVDWEKIQQEQLEKHNFGMVTIEMMSSPIIFPNAGLPYEQLLKEITAMHIRLQHGLVNDVKLMLEALHDPNLVEQAELELKEALV